MTVAGPIACAAPLPTVSVVLFTIAAMSLLFSAFMFGRASKGGA